MRLIATCLLIALIFLPAAALSQANVTGFGGLSCREVVTYRASDQKQVDFLLGQWVLGYLSAVNMFRMTQFNEYRDLSAITPDFASDWVIHNCATKPDAIIIALLPDLYGTLRAVEYGRQP